MNNPASKFDLEAPSKMTCLVYNNTGYCPRQDLCKSEHIATKEPNVLSILHAYVFDKIRKNGTQTKPVSNTHFTEFFTDFLQELQKIGEVKVLKVLSNDSEHLEGNVLVEFSNKSKVQEGFEKFNNRLYNGSRLKCKLIYVKDWRTATCGKFTKQNCISHTCPFFHYLRNPKNAFKFDFETREEPQITTESSSRDYKPGQYSTQQSSRDETYPNSYRPVVRRAHPVPRLRTGYRAAAFNSKYATKSEEQPSQSYEQPQYIRKSKPAYTPRPYYSNQRYMETQPEYPPYNDYNDYNKRSEHSHYEPTNYNSSYNTNAYNDGYNNQNNYKPNNYGVTYPRPDNYAPAPNQSNYSDYNNTSTYPTYNRRGGRRGYYPRR